MAIIVIIVVAVAASFAVRAAVLSRFPELFADSSGAAALQQGKRAVTFGALGAAERLADAHPLDAEEAESYRLKLARAGIAVEPKIWRGLELALAAACGAVGLAYILQTGTPWAVLVFAFSLGVGFAVPRFLLWNLTRDRRSRIESNMASTLELLSVTVKSGYPIERGIRLIGQTTRGPLGAEFRRVDNDINLAGIAMERALKAMAQRCDAPSVNSFCTALVQAIQQGTSVSRVLDAQARLARNEHYSQLKVKINKLPAKLVAPVFGIMMLIIVLVLAPPIYNTAQTFLDVYQPVSYEDAAASLDQ